MDGACVAMKIVSEQVEEWDGVPTVCNQRMRTPKYNLT
jgi:hypothetical protein